MELSELSQPTDGEPALGGSSGVHGSVFVGLGLVLAGFVAIAAFIAVAPRSGQAETNPPELLQFSGSSASLEAAGSMWLDTSDKVAVSNLFLTEFTKPIPDTDWQGDHASCDGGTSSAALRQATIDRVNYYRAMAGVSATVVENEEFSEKAHSGAIMMSVEGALTHEPPPSFACYTEFGFEAASKSNLYLGRTGPSAIDGYVEDPGEDNADVGHRNTLLHPPTTEMGVANVEARDGYDKSNLLWVFDDGVFEKNAPAREEDGFVAWPPKGYVPQEVVYERWSFSLLGGDFSDATVNMAVNGQPIPISSVTIEGKAGRVPNPIIVWEPELGDSSAELRYDIEISGVLVEGVLHDYNYSVTVLEPLLDK